MSSKDFVSTFKQKYPKLQTTPRMKLIELSKHLLATLYAWSHHECPSHVGLEGLEGIEKLVLGKSDGVENLPE
ncbi:hypothetical protein TcWFU_009165 [Taenia crassiceps]|uniref:Uncharacterized protein n=1 Tax=Taenia crassiceps TaxID=6207 RepID=A0ABR4Q8I8_9CEST